MRESEFLCLDHALNRVFSTCWTIVHAFCVQADEKNTSYDCFIFLYDFKVNSLFLNFWCRRRMPRDLPQMDALSRLRMRHQKLTRARLS